MIASACLTLALVHGVVWWRHREAWANLLFALTAVATSLLAAGEVWMMWAETPEQFGMAVRWTHLPAWALIVSLVGFVRLYLRAGRQWLAWTVCGLRTLRSFQFFHWGELNYREVAALQRIPFLGESVSVGEGVESLMLVGQLSLVLLVIFAADAAFTVWRRGDRRQALVVGGGIVFCVLMGTGQAILVFWGIISAPITASLFYMGIVAAMGFELSHDVLRAAELSEELRESERRMDLAASAAELGLWVWDMERDEIWTTDKGTSCSASQRRAAQLSRIIERLHPDDREPMRVAVTTALENDGNYHNEYRLLSGAASVRWIAAQGRVEFAADRRPRLMRGVSIDITARRLAEQEVQERRAELTHLSRVAMLGELSGSLAHELNQPLTAILNNAQATFLARPQINRAELEEILSDIVDADQHAGEVIRSLRLLLKKGEVQRQQLDANEVVQEVLNLVRSDLLNHRVAAEAKLAPDLPTVRGDRVQLQQVMLNLVMNACDAMAGSDERDAGCA
jgi:signal transduction histidine kinase